MNRDGLEKIWPQLSPIFDEMWDGLCFFEGYVFGIEVERLDEKLASLLNSDNYTCDNSVWFDNVDEQLMQRKDISMKEYMLLFKEKQICLLAVNYSVTLEGQKFDFMLLIDYDIANFDLEIVCYREVFLASKDIKRTAYLALEHMEGIKNIFHGNSLYVTSDFSNMPESEKQCPKDWIKL